MCACPCRHTRGRIREQGLHACRTPQRTLARSRRRRRRHQGAQKSILPTAFRSIVREGLRCVGVRRHACRLILADRTLEPTGPQRWKRARLLPTPPTVTKPLPACPRRFQARAHPDRLSGTPPRTIPFRPRGDPPTQTPDGDLSTQTQPLSAPFGAARKGASPGFGGLAQKRKSGDSANLRKSASP